MENKKTSELLDLLTKLVDKDGNLQDGWQEAWDELAKREPFFQIINKDYDESLEMRVDDLERRIKLLNRHRHDGTDVVVRL